MHPEFLEECAQAGYALFRERHADLPPWEELPEETQVRWRSAAPDVYRSLGQEPPNEMEECISEALKARKEGANAV